MVSAKRKQQLKQQLRPWNDHVAKVKAANPNLEYKEVLKKAKRSYKKGKSSTKSGALAIKTSKYSVHVRSTRSSSKKKPKKKPKKRSSRRKTGWLW